MRKLLLFTWIFPFFLSAQSDFKNIQLKNTGVTNVLNGISEPAIAIDPNNPSIMAAGSIMNAYYYSTCLLYTSPSPRDGLLSRMPSSA